MKLFFLQIFVHISISILMTIYIILPHIIGLISIWQELQIILQEGFSCSYEQPPGDYLDVLIKRRLQQVYVFLTFNNTNLTVYTKEITSIEWFLGLIINRISVVGKYHIRCLFLNFHKTFS